MLLAIDKIRRDGGTQMRASLDAAAVDEYAERMEAGDEFPPVIVFHDGEERWLADGFHRIAAAERLEESGGIAADIRAGTLREAIRFAITANARHGLRRSNEDKRIAVKAALEDPEWREWSSRVIAETVGVASRTVDRVREQLRQSRSTEDGETAPPRKSRDGKKRPAKQPKGKRPAKNGAEKADGGGNKEPPSPRAPDPEPAPSFTVTLSLGDVEFDDAAETLEQIVQACVARFDRDDLARLRQETERLRRVIAAAERSK